MIPSLPSVAGLSNTKRCYSNGVAVTFTSSADRHKIPRDDAVYAMLNAEVSAQVPGNPGRVTMLYIGHPHAQTDRYIEVIAEVNPPDGVKIFHVMDLSDMYRHLVS